MGSKSHRPQSKPSKCILEIEENNLQGLKLIFYIKCVIFEIQKNNCF